MTNCTFVFFPVVLPFDPSFPWLFNVDKSKGVMARRQWSAILKCDMEHNIVSFSDMRGLSEVDDLSEDLLLPEEVEVLAVWIHLRAIFIICTCFSCNSICPSMDNDGKDVDACAIIVLSLEDGRIDDSLEEDDDEEEDDWVVVIVVLACIRACLV